MASIFEYIQLWEDLRRKEAHELTLYDLKGLELFIAGWKEILKEQEKEQERQSPEV